MSRTPPSLHLELNDLDGRNRRRIMPGTYNELVLQPINLDRGRVEVNNSLRRVNNLAVSLLENTPTNFRSTVTWLVTLISFAFTLFSPYDGPLYTGYYETYPRGFSELPWVTSSPMEPSLYERESQTQPLPTPHDATGQEITFALCPRYLMLYDRAHKCWLRCSKQEILKQQRYVAVSYRQSDFFTRGEGENVQKEVLIKSIQHSCLSIGHSAYWLDFQCTGESQEEKNLDLYRIADVFRGASRTLIKIKETSDDMSSSQGWKSWGSRVWTLPEALLGPCCTLCYTVGTGLGPVHDIGLHQVANLAYEHHDKEMAIINTYGGRETLGRIEHLLLLKDAIWRRFSGPPSQSSVANASASEFTAYPAERVYALMGFFEHRIEPNLLETESQALARLFLANYNDRFLARMVSMLPRKISPTSCWYSDEDVYCTKLWEVEPCIQVLAISKTGAVVVDDCRAAVMKWNGFPEVAFQRDKSFKRLICCVLPRFFWLIFLMSLGLLAVSSVLSIFVMGVSFTLLFVSPRLIIYGHSGRVNAVQPWLIGAKGVVTVEEASRMVCGKTEPGPIRFSYNARGSTLSIPHNADIPRGNPSQASIASRLRNVYTLIDTVSRSVYYFQAERVPTVCVFTGLEGGLGRFVLCSEGHGRCEGELHKETVLRMPTHVGDMMRRCDRIAIGGLGDDSQ
ncbi:hypothetical protein SERLA73DRAFT_71562 [Serpula lacrymans var. lacrymans S7.3]|uniref:Heterokaryon incompatibility domain-containing protein n=1 Tax=Serpula lacrymans var. lacrymans (strain S7.3) TaxID=936435 RepID=F8PRC4_SERL3|nr:hypothetical protein SERLA73DRAFT_71562 [Serpula lacrymans var. lacrymans S7.3]